MRRLTHKHHVIEDVFGGKFAELSAKGEGGCHTLTAGGPSFSVFDQHMAGLWFLQGRSTTYNDRVDMNKLQ